MRHQSSGVLRPTLAQLETSLISSNGSSMVDAVTLGLNIPDRMPGERIAMSLSARMCSEDWDAMLGESTTGEGERAAAYICGETAWISVKGEPASDHGSPAWPRGCVCPWLKLALERMSKNGEAIRDPDAEEGRETTSSYGCMLPVRDDSSSLPAVLRGPMTAGVKELADDVEWASSPSSEPLESLRGDRDAVPETLLGTRNSGTPGSDKTVLILGAAGGCAGLVGMLNVVEARGRGLCMIGGVDRFIAGCVV